MRYCLLLPTLICLVVFTSLSYATTIHVPDDFPTIQGAIDACVDGDTVLVAEGTYYERLNFEGKSIVVASHFILNGEQRTIENTIIDADTSVIGVADSGSVVTMVNREDSSTVLSGFTIVRGIGTKIGESYYGGGIYCVGASPRIEHNMIEDNRAVSSQENTDGWGGGIYVKSGEPLIRFNRIERNTAVGLGMYVLQGEGGGIWIGNCPAGSIDRNIVSSNYTGGNGAGIYCSSSQVLINGNEITNNDGSGYGLCCSYASPVIQHNLIESNQNGGLECYRSDALIENNIISRHMFGGGICISNSSSPTVRNNVIFENEYFMHNYGGGIQIRDDSAPVLLNNIIVSNIGVGIYSDGQGPAKSDYNNVWDHTYGNYRGLHPGPNDISFDPLFRSFHGFDYILDRGSPCIDAGDPDIEDGRTWPIWYNNGIRSDMGAYGGPGNAGWLWNR